MESRLRRIALTVIPTGTQNYRWELLEIKSEIGAWGIMHTSDIEFPSYLEALDDGVFELENMGPSKTGPLD